MTFVGKVLVIVQVVLSLCFMAFAGAVFTVQQDWKKAYEDKVAEVGTINETLRQKDEQISLLNKDLAATQALEQDVASYLNGFDQFQDIAAKQDDDAIKTQLRMLATKAQTAESELNTKIAELTAKDKLLADETKKYDTLENDYKQAADEARERRQEAENLQKANKNLTAQVQVAQDRIFTLEDELFNRETDARGMAEKQKSLLVQVASLKDVIRREGIDEEEALAKDEPPPIVYGKVLNTKAADRKGPEYVEISIGSHDGLAVGHELDVFRTTGGGKYLGRIEIKYVEGDRAVGTVILKTKNGIIQREDNVTTKL